jgi:chromosome segregation ATPase
MELDQTKRELEMCKSALEAATANQTTLRDEITRMRSQHAAQLQQAELKQANLREEFGQTKQDFDAAVAKQRRDYASLHERFSRTQSENTALREHAQLERDKLGEKLGQAKLDLEVEVAKRISDRASLKDHYRRHCNNQLDSLQGGFDAEVNAIRDEAEQNQANLKNELDKTWRELATSKVTMAKQKTDYSHLQDQITYAQSDNAALRDQVKFVDDIEATHVVNELDEIRHAVDQICMNICNNTETAQALNRNTSNLTADNICDWEQLKSISAPPLSLWEAATGKSRDLFALLDNRSVTIPFFPKRCSSYRSCSA